MKKIMTAAIALAATLSLSSPLYATGDMDKSAESKHQAGAAYDQESKDLKFQTGTAQAPSAEELQGMQVVSRDGEEIGEIQKVRVDEQSGDISFVTISKGGVLGIGGEEIAVPFEAFRFDQDRATLTVDTSKLDTAPNQEQLSDAEFQRDLQTHYGVSPAWEDRQQDQSEAIDPGQQQEMDVPTLEDSGKTAPDKKEY